jgi:hypothetical protein
MVDGRPLKVRPETAVLGYAEGDVIAVSADDVARLADGVLAEITKRFGE